MSPHRTTSGRAAGFSMTCGTPLATRRSRVGSYSRGCSTARWAFVPLVIAQYARHGGDACTRAYRLISPEEIRPARYSSASALTNVYG